jgi:hypothetical protein
MAQGEPTELYVYGTGLHHDPVEGDLPPTDTLYLTRDEKRHIADAQAEGTYREVPVNWNHTGPRIGRVMHSTVSGSGRFMPVVQLFWDRPETRQVLERLKRGERLGYSLGVGYQKDDASKTVHDKHLDHIAITDEPEFGAEGTWLERYALSPNGIVNEMAPYLRDDAMYVPRALRERYAPLLASRVPAKAAFALGDAAETKPSGSKSGAQPHGALVSAQRLAIASRRMATPAETVTTTEAAAVPPVAAAPAATPAPSVPVTVDEFLRECNELNRLVSDSFTKAPESLDKAKWWAAQEAAKRYETAMEKANFRNFSQWPPEYKESYNKLQHYLSIYNDYLKQVLTEEHGNDEAAIREATAIIHDPLAGRSMRGIVVANMDKRHQNYRQEAQRLQEERAAKEKSDHDARLQAVEKRARDAEEQLEQLKRTRTETAPTSRDASAPAAGGVTVETSVVTASRVSGATPAEHKAYFAGVGAPAENSAKMLGMFPHLARKTMDPALARAQQLVDAMVSGNKLVVRDEGFGGSF